MSAPGPVNRPPDPPDQEMRDFVSRAVHDLREPLRAISAGAQMLAAAPAESSGDHHSRCLGLIYEGLDSLEVLIRGLAGYCYDQIHEREPVQMDLTQALLEAQRQMSERLKQSQAVMTCDRLPTVRADFIELAALFQHLIENACKFRSDAPLRIHVGAQQGAGEWLISVRDNGCGFHPRYKDLIFLPFERLNGKQFPGSGLGLARARRIVEQNRGRIWAESQPGEGTTIWFSLPSVG